MSSWHLRRRTSLCAVFQQLDIDYLIGQTDYEWLPHRRSDKAAIIRMFGVNAQGMPCPVSASYSEPLVRDVGPITILRVQD
jgi:hypothetical protein